MDNKFRRLIIIVLFFYFNSCGWVEGEDPHELRLKYEYSVSYDTKNIAFNYFSIGYGGGTPILDNCIEFYLDNNYLYLKQLIGFNEEQESRYFKINNRTRNITKIDKTQYDKNAKNCTLINFQSISEKGDFEIPSEYMNKEK
ncbi:hypothetical protein [Mangrovimonas sp. TPBH4]|uniref:hypothetical protein n=1 Tax=Mangrovimonas sp. TPBH4 TaxID=1645914 RepID=UPI0006B45412|nr:hypothetical protein [Mangrovimonas sp. TPBH4]